MAAFCTCCGAAITLKSMACPVCGSPSHGRNARVERKSLAKAETASETAVGVGLFEAKSEAGPEVRQCVGCFAA